MVSYHIEKECRYVFVVAVLVLHTMPNALQSIMKLHAWMHACMDAYIHRAARDAFMLVVIYQTVLPGGRSVRISYLG